MHGLLAALRKPGGSLDVRAAGTASQDRRSRLMHGWLTVFRKPEGLA